MLVTTPKERGKVFEATLLFAVWSKPYNLPRHECRVPIQGGKSTNVDEVSRIEFNAKWQFRSIVATLRSLEDG